MIAIENAGRTPAGTETTRFALTAGAVTVRIMDFGATILGIEVPDRTGHTDDVVLGFDGLDGYLGNPACYGATIGPSANRIARAEVPLGGTVCHLAANEGPNNLHTDLARGLHKRMWRARALVDENAVTMTCALADGELGLPGNRTFTATFALVEQPDGAVELAVAYRCETDAPTFVNMTNHTYFNLAGHGSGSSLGQVAQIEAKRFLPIDGASIPTGEMRSVESTPFDFRAAKPLGRDIEADDEQLRLARGYDHCFCIDGYAPGRPPRPAARIEDPASGRILEVDITTPGLQLYTGNWLDDASVKGGISYAPGSGVALEPEFYPDVPHHPAWPHPLCTPERPYTSTIRYRFSVR